VHGEFRIVSELTLKTETKQTVHYIFFYFSFFKFTKQQNSKNKDEQTNCIKSHKKNFQKAPEKNSILCIIYCKLKCWIEEQAKGSDFSF
jgi:hypothetical protein